MNYFEFLEYYKNIKTKYTVTTAINTNTTALVIYAFHIEQALLHYQKTSESNLNALTLVLIDVEKEEDLYTNEFVKKAQKNKLFEKITLVSKSKINSLTHQNISLFASAYYMGIAGPSITSLCAKYYACNIDKQLFIDQSCFYKNESTRFSSIPVNTLKLAYTIFNALADDESKECYARAIKANIEGNPAYLTVSPYEQYQHKETLAKQGDTLIDGGLFDGATSVIFAKQVGEKGKVIGFEPVQAQYKICLEKTKAYPQIKVEPYGLWSEKSNFYIKGSGAGSFLSDSGNEFSEKCTSVALDDFLPNTKIDVLKLDIEGAELECLKGAEKHISNSLPSLHISLYHHTHELNTLHFYEIPLYIMEKYPQYELYFGHHNTWFWESVLYAKAR